MTSPAAEAAFEEWVEEHPPGTANVHTAFIAGWEARAGTSRVRAIEDPRRRIIGRDDLPDPEKP